MRNSYLQCPGLLAGPKLLDGMDGLELHRPSLHDFPLPPLSLPTLCLCPDDVWRGVLQPRRCERAVLHPVPRGAVQYRYCPKQLLVSQPLPRGIHVPCRLLRSHPVPRGLLLPRVSRRMHRVSTLGALLPRRQRVICGVHVVYHAV
jgi:hypothetical protein